MLHRFERPQSIAEAARLLASGSWAVLAGGTDLYPGARRPTDRRAAARHHRHRRPARHPPRRPRLDDRRDDDLERRRPRRPAAAVRRAQGGGARGRRRADPEHRHGRRQPVQRLAGRRRHAGAARARRARRPAERARRARRWPSTSSCSAAGARRVPPTSSSSRCEIPARSRAGALGVRQARRPPLPDDLDQRRSRSSSTSMRTARSPRPASPSAAARRSRSGCRRSRRASSASPADADLAGAARSRRPRAADADRRPARQRRLPPRRDRHAGAPRPARGRLAMSASTRAKRAAESRHGGASMTARDLPAIQVVRIDVNGRARELAGDPAPAPRRRLRDELGLTGTKIGCHAGDCGACTVLLDGEQVCSCIVGVGQCDGRAVTTVEGLAGADGALSPLQRAFVAHGAAQCGICTPGMLMSAEALLRANPQPTEAEVLRRARRRALPLHRLPQDRRGGARRRGGRGRRRAGGARRAARSARAWRGSTRRRRSTGSERFGADALPQPRPTPAADDARRPLAACARPLRGRRPRRACARAGPASSTSSRAADVPNNAFAIFPDLRDQPVLADGVVALSRRGGARARRRRGDAGRDRRADVPIRYTPLAAPEASADALAAAGAARRCTRASPTTSSAAAASCAATSTPRSRAASHRASATLRDASRRARLHRARGRLRRDRRGQRLRSAARRCAASASSPARRRPTWTATRSRACWGSRPSRSTSCRRRSAAASAASSTSRCSRCSRSPPGSSAARCAWSTSGPSRCSRAPSAIRRRCGRAPACDADGRLVAFDFAGDFNTGAYSSWGPTVANRVPIHASGPYRIANVRALTRAVLTHNSVAGAFRGFGVPQSTLLGELLIDELAARSRMRPARVPPSQCARRRRHDADRADARRERRPAAPASMRCGRPGRRRRRRRAPSTSERSRDGGIAAAPRRRHRLHVVRHRQHRDRQSVDDARRLALERRARRASLPLQRRAGDRPGHRDDHAADVRRRGRPRAVVRRAGDGRHRPDRRRRQVVGVAPDLRLRQRRQGRGRRPAPAADRAARLRAIAPMRSVALALDGDRLGRPLRRRGARARPARA